MLLPFVWTLFALSAVAGFVMLAAYWLDLSARNDLSRRARFGWLAGILVFPVTIPIYAFTTQAQWPRLLRIGAFIPLFGLALFFGFVFGAFS